MNNSLFWARTLGLYCVIVSIGMFFNLKSLQAMMADIPHQPSLWMITGIFTLLLGLAIVVSHSIWKGWPIIITLVGYWIIIKGSILLFFPHVIDKVVAFWQGKNMMFAPLPALILGLILLYCGFLLREKI